jgi:hypothetical protein
LINGYGRLRSISLHYLGIEVDIFRHGFPV